MPDYPLLEKWRNYLRDYESPELYIDWAYYSLISACLQRRVWLDDKPRECFPNLYLLLIGPPATGKSMLIAVIGYMLRNGMLAAVNPETKQLEQKINVAPDSITLEGLTQALSKNYQRTHRFVGPDGKNGAYVHCSLQFLCEELGVLLRKHTEDMVNVLIQGFDARQIDRVTKISGNDLVRNVCLGMIGGTTPRFMKEAFDERLIGEGFSSRFVMLYESGPRFLREHPGFSTEQEQCWVDLFNHINKKVTTAFGQCRFSPEAAAWRKDYYESGMLVRNRINHDITLDHYYSRKNLLWKKLSIVLHHSEDYTNNEIQLSTVQRALRILDDAEPRMHLAFTSIGKNALYSLQLQISRTIALYSERGGIAVNELFNQYNKDLNMADYTECITSMVTSGQITKNGNMLTIGKHRQLKSAGAVALAAATTMTENINTK